MSSPSCYYARQVGRTWSVFCSHRGELLDGIECSGSALDHIAELEAQDAEAEAAEHAELDAIYDAVNARGGYVPPGDMAGEGRGRAIDAVIAAIEALKAERAERGLLAAAQDRGQSVAALAMEAA